MLTSNNNASVGTFGDPSTASIPDSIEQAQGSPHHAGPSRWPSSPASDSNAAHVRPDLAATWTSCPSTVTSSSSLSSRDSQTRSPLARLGDQMQSQIRLDPRAHWGKRNQRTHDEDDGEHEERMRNGPGAGDDDATADSKINWTAGLPASQSGGDDSSSSPAHLRPKPSTDALTVSDGSSTTVQANVASRSGLGTRGGLNIEAGPRWSPTSLRFTYNNPTHQSTTSLTPAPRSPRSPRAAAGADIGRTSSLLSPAPPYVPPGGHSSGTKSLQSQVKSRVSFLAPVTPNLQVTGPSGHGNGSAPPIASPTIQRKPSTITAVDPPHLLPRPLSHQLADVPSRAATPSRAQQRLSIDEQRRQSNRYSALLLQMETRLPPLSMPAADFAKQLPLPARSGNAWTTAYWVLQRFVVLPMQIWLPLVILLLLDLDVLFILSQLALCPVVATPPADTAATGQSVQAQNIEDASRISATWWLAFGVYAASSVMEIGTTATRLLRAHGRLTIQRGPKAAETYMTYYDRIMAKIMQDGVLRLFGKADRTSTWGQRIREVAFRWQQNWVIMPFELSRLVIAVTITLTTSFGGVRSHSQSIQLEQAGQKGNFAVHSGRIGSFFDIRSGNLNQYGQWLVVGGAAWMTLNIMTTLASLLICASFYLCSNSAQSKAEKANSRPASLLLAETLGLPPSFELPRRSWQQATEDRIKFVLLEYEIRQPVKSAVPSYLETDKPDVAALTGLGISRLSYLSPPALAGPDLGFNALQAPPVIPPRVSSYHAAVSTGLEGIHQMLAAQEPAAGKGLQISSPQQQARPDHLRPFDEKATDSPGRRSPSLVSVVRAYSPLLAAAGDALAKRRSVQPQVGIANAPNSNGEEKDVVDEASTWSISFVEADESTREQTEEGATAEAAEDTTRESGQSYRIWNMFPEQRQQIAAARAAKEMAVAAAVPNTSSTTSEGESSARPPVQETQTPLVAKSYPTLQVSSVDQGMAISYGTPLHDIIEEPESAAGSLASRPSDTDADAEGGSPGEQGDADK